MTQPIALDPFETSHGIFNHSGKGALIQPPSEGEGTFDFSPWEAPHRLTISFVPDGTEIAGSSSNLYAAFAGLLTAAELEGQISRAFQTWARRSNINIGLVADDGSPLGTPGLAQGETRFGDIRVGAIPMADDVLAVAVSNGWQVSGTWGGDVLFNSNTVFPNAKKFYAVALHEAGHVLGLPHSADPASPMHPIANSTFLTQNDAAQLRTIYGLRRLDPHERHRHTNNTLDSATRIDNPGSPHGANPLVVFGDLSRYGDIDYYRLKPHSDATGDLRFQVRSTTRSMLQFQMEVFDEFGSSYGTAVSGATLGADLTVVVNNLDRDIEYYVRIAAAKPSPFSTGSYSLTAVFADQVSSTGLALLPEVQNGDLAFLPQSDIRKIFEEPLPSFNDDVFTNETFATALDLDTVAGFSEGMLYRFDGGLTSALDVDVYRFRSPDKFANGSTLTVTLSVLEASQLITDITLFDSNLQPLDARVLVNGNGQLVVQLAESQPNTDYYVRIEPDPNSPLFQTGNYRVQMRFGGAALVPIEFAAGTLTSAQPRVYHNLFIAETQMFNLTLAAQGADQGLEHNIWSTIFDGDGNVVYRGLTVNGEIRSRQSVILKPGTYLIRSELVDDGSTLNRIRLDFTLHGTDVDEPTGPELVDVTTMPFQPCTDNPSQYCYPGGNQSAEPYIIVNGKLVAVANEPVTAPTLSNINTWYWNPTNSL